MTVLHAPRTAKTPAPPALALGAARLLAGTRDAHTVTWAEHTALHGTPRRLDQAALVTALEQVRMLGRGGAAFPVSIKLAGTPSGARTEVVVNGSEGEPASFKDRTLMRLAPHLVLDGAVTVAGALRTRRVSVLVHDADAADALEAARAERRDADRISIRRTGSEHGFVGGEVRAVTRALSGGPSVPPGRRVLPAVSGVDGRPTFASNVETFAQIGLLALLGPTGYSAVGAPAEPGTTLLTVFGDVPRSGVLEVPTGLPVAALLGEGTGPVLIGGYHGRWTTTAGLGELRVLRPDLRAAGLALNAGVLVRLPTDTCALGEVARVTRWLASESAGQCGPCHFGLPALAEVVESIATGREGGAGVDRALRLTGLLPGRGACAHPDGSAAFVASALQTMTDELEAHRHGGCGRPVRGVLPVPTR